LPELANSLVLTGSGGGSPARRLPSLPEYSAFPLGAVASTPTGPIRRLPSLPLSSPRSPPPSYVDTSSSTISSVARDLSRIRGLEPYVPCNPEYRRIRPLPAGLTPPRVPRIGNYTWGPAFDWEEAAGIGETIRSESPWSSMEEEIIGDLFRPIRSFADVRQHLGAALNPFVDTDDSSGNSNSTIL
jgi:hypothetical protein